MRLTLLAIVLAVTNHACCVAFDSAPTPKELVQQLVSPNKPVNPKGKPFVGSSKDYDREAQKTVEKASKELLKLGFRAIPDLIAGLDDERYCRTEVYSRAVDWSVGYECYRLLEGITSPAVQPDYDALPKSQFESVKGYACRIGADGKQHMFTQSYLDLVIFIDRKSKPDSKSLDKWWKGFADKSLDHIHLAAVQRLIAHEEKIGFPPGADKDRFLKPYRDLEERLRSRIQSPKDSPPPPADSSKKPLSN